MALQTRNDLDRAAKWWGRRTIVRVFLRGWKVDGCRGAAAAGVDILGMAFRTGFFVVVDRRTTVVESIMTFILMEGPVCIYW